MKPICFGRIGLWWILLSLVGLLSQTLLRIGLLARVLLPKIGLSELELTVLHGRTFLLLMALLVWTKLALTDILGGIFLSQMGLPGK